MTTSPRLRRIGLRVVFRAASIVVLLLAVTLATFLVLRVGPGDAAATRFGEEGATPEEIALVREQLGLDRPLVEQYTTYVADMARGDFGRSFVNDRPVLELIQSRLPVTLSLTVTSILVAIPLTLVLGIVAGAREGRPEDTLITAWNSVMIAVPTFFLGMLLALFFAVHWRWLPSTGYVSIFDNPVDFVRHMTLPAITLGTTLAASLARQLRSSFTEIMSQDYILAAESRGIAWPVILGKHVLKNAAIPTVTLFGLQVISLIGGSIIIEQVFALPGLGQLAIGAVFARDTPVIQGIVVITAIIAIAVNLSVDSVYRVLNPRIKAT